MINKLCKSIFKFWMNGFHFALILDVILDIKVITQKKFWHHLLTQVSF